MGRMRAKLLALVAVVGLAVPTVAGSAVVAQTAPEHPNRVLIVLFDQMLPEYADQFDMPNFRSLRDAGTNFKRRLPRLHGVGDRHGAQRDHVGTVARSTWDGPMRRTATRRTCSVAARTRCTSPAT